MDKIRLTRCPSCSTTFKVSDGQLAAYDGKVRCGCCSFIFMAPLCFVVPPPIEPAISRESNSSRELNSEIGKLEAHDAFGNPDQIELPGKNAIMDSENGDEATDSVGGDSIFSSGGKQSKKKNQWALPIAILFFVSIFQVIFFNRTQITVEVPYLRPYFVTLCQCLGCRMPLPEKKEFLHLEWSEMSFIPGYVNLVQLSATLRNQASFNQALPLLELTLMDPQGIRIARRVFQPSEYLAEGENETIFLKDDELRAYLQLDLGRLKPSGYTIAWFYG